MKILLKFLQYIFKFLASMFYKLGAQYTYTKLYKYLMKYKFISIIYKPLKFIFKNIIYFIKLSSAIIAILSLLNISLFYYNLYIIDEAISYINNIIPILYFFILFLITFNTTYNIYKECDVKFNTKHDLIMFLILTFFIAFLLWFYTIIILVMLLPI
jgi:hypothetical protein